MSTGRHSFKQNDAARLIRAVEAAGKTVTGVILKDGAVTLLVDGAQPAAANKSIKPSRSKANADRSTDEYRTAVDVE